MSQIKQANSIVKMNSLNRRNFLISIAGVSLAPQFTLAGGGGALSIGVVGGGIIGASIAMNLAQAGADVILFEKTAPAHGATSKSFAWINANSKNEDYRNLRLESIAAYHELEKKFPLGVIWGGYLNWESEPDAISALRTQILDCERSNCPYPLRLLDAEEFARIAPNIKPSSFETAIYRGMDGHVDPVGVTNMFLDEAKKHGAQVIYPCEVTELELNGNRLVGVLTNRGKFMLDRLVIANGVDAPDLTAKIGYTTPLKHAPGILAHSKPIKSLLKTVNDGSGVLFKQMSNGAIVGSDSYLPPDTPVHQGIREKRMDYPSDAIRDMHGMRILDRITEVLPASRDMELDRLTLGFRPLPDDNFPIVGFIPGYEDIYLAVMHSGVTLAPIVGRSVSREMLMDDTVDSLAAFRPNRFFQQPLTYDL